MKAAKDIATYQRLRAMPLWRLLAADNGPIVIALLQAHFSEGQKTIPASVLLERIGHDLERLREVGGELPQSAQAYVADWLSKGWFERRFPAGAAEEEYELSAAAASAIRFVASLIAPRVSATESRLATVIHELVRLAEDTDSDPQSRIASLIAERNRIDEHIQAVQQGKVKAISEEQAFERIREIMTLADELASDFRRVRSEFEKLNRDLRERILDEDGRRGEVLAALFSGVDVIAQSEAGRTFVAFWRLLTDLEQSLTLEQALDDVLSRQFAQQLETRERRFLLRIPRTLLDEGGEVHAVQQHFARSLKHFVQSREYLEQRRLMRLLKNAERAALALKDRIKVADQVGYTLGLTTSRIRSVSQWVLFDPALHRLEGGMVAGDAAPIDLETLSNLVAHSEIDFRALRRHVCAVLERHSQASIGQVLEYFPAEQGLGSVVGYMALGTRYGLRGSGAEHVSWRGHDEEERRARIPEIHFLRGRINELASD